jgi:signal transduction histidine kinase
MFSERATGHQIKLRREGEEGLVNADQQRIHQVLSNLIGNAFKHTPDGGEIVVTSRIERDHVTIEVRDTGSGIASDQLPRIFERYWQREGGASGGLGLGLYICRSLIEAHGGRIWAESAVGDGTRVYFTLPRAS